MFQTRKAALIVESRPLPRLASVIREHAAMLPPDWGVILVGWGAVQAQGELGALQRDVISLRRQPTIHSIADYNALMTSPGFWDDVGAYARHVLVFQHDSTVLRPGIESFAGLWGIVGAPWTRERFVGADWGRGLEPPTARYESAHGGNGGLSMRDVRAMHKACSGIAVPRGGEHEDFFFARALLATGARPAPLWACRAFSCEEELLMGTFGCHAPERYHHQGQVEKIYGQYRCQTLDGCGRLGVRCELRAPHDGAEHSCEGFRQHWTKCPRCGCQGRRGVFYDLLTCSACGREFERSDANARTS